MVKIEILGTHCAKCKSLAKNVEKAVAELGIRAEVVNVDSIQEIMDRGSHDGSSTVHRWRV